MSGELLIAIARNSIGEHFESQGSFEKLSWLQQDPALQQQRACFVTLSLHGQLRGCIGSIIPHRPLIDDIYHNAQAAAFGDPRFPPLSSDEFETVEIEVSLLTIPQKFDYASVDDLKAHIGPQHGVILKQGHAQATFLPQVWEQLPDFESFFAHLCNKAGLEEGCLKDFPEIYLYEVEIYKE